MDDLLPRGVAAIRIRDIAAAQVLQTAAPLYATSVGRWRAYAEGLAPFLEKLPPPARLDDACFRGRAVLGDRPVPAPAPGPPAPAPAPVPPPAPAPAARARAAAVRVPVAAPTRAAAAAPNATAAAAPNATRDAPVDPSANRPAAAAAPRRTYQEVNGPVPTGPAIDAEGLAQQISGPTPVSAAAGLGLGLIRGAAPPASPPRSVEPLAGVEAPAPPPPASPATSASATPRTPELGRSAPSEYPRGAPRRGRDSPPTAAPRQKTSDRAETPKTPATPTAPSSADAAPVTLVYAGDADRPGPYAVRLSLPAAWRRRSAADVARKALSAFTKRYAAAHPAAPPLGALAVAADDLFAVCGGAAVRVERVSPV